MRFALASAMCLAIALSVATPAAAADAKGFTIQDTAGKCTDVLLDGKPVARYMYAFDGSTAESLHETYKPYLHIIDPATGQPITKGAGGQYSHHRGIFGGWKTTTAGKTYDFWHIVRDLANAQKVVGKPHFLMLHQKFEKSAGGADNATLAAAIGWNDPEGKTLVQELRTMAFSRATMPNGIVQADFTTCLKPLADDATFGGDPEHAGVHYRPAAEIDTKQTKYLFHAEGIDPKKDKDLPWVAMQYTVGAKTYTVVQMSAPANPKGTLWSAYRDYGRFGAYPTFQVKKGESQSLNYRFVILSGTLPARETIQKAYEGYAK